MARYKEVLYMATAKAIATDAKTRSLELARERGYHGSGPARSIGMTLSDDGQLVSLAVRVPSASSDAEHIVTYIAAGEQLTCDCPAAAHGRPCWHKGVGLAAGRYVARRAQLGWPED
jgi:hypothetical protein